MSDNGSEGEISVQSVNTICSICSRCDNKISPKKLKKLPTCKQCCRTFHYQCSSVVAKTWSSLSPAVKSDWTCVDCRLQSSQSNTPESPGRERSRKRSTSSSDEGLRSDYSNEKRTKILPDPTIVYREKNHPEMSSVKSQELLAEMGRLLSAFKEEITGEIHGIKTTMTETVKQQLEEQAKQTKLVTDALRTQIVEVKSKCEYQSSQIVEMQQYSRKNNVIIHGVEEIGGERPIQTALRIAEIFNFRLDERDIDACHRLPSRKQLTRGKDSNTVGELAPRPFIIRFVRRICKTDFLIHCKTNKRDGVFVNEHLTPVTAEILKHAKQTLITRGYRVETRDCQVFANKEGEKRIKIASVSAISELIMGKIQSASANVKDK